MFDIDPDKPNTPGIARILSVFGMLSLIGSIGSMLLSFSGYPWINDAYAIAGALSAFLLGIIMLGQAKIIDQLAMVSARVKSRFAIEHAMMPSTPAAAPKPAQSLTAPKERVITIPEEEARKQGVTRTPRTTL
jgi:hypothetical protein